ALTKTGNGTLTLNGQSNQFAGSTEVGAGTLMVGDGKHTDAALGGNVTVDNAATLGGHGTIGGNVDVASGGIVTPGNSIGTLRVQGNFTAAQGSVLDYEFGAPASPNPFTTFGGGDSITVGGDLTLNGTILNVTDAGG